MKNLILAPRVLIVGDGDFSFSRAAARLRSESNTSGQLICSSFDSIEEVLNKYPNAKSHLDHLNDSNRYRPESVCVQHRVDATKLQRKFQATRFDRIVFNFPHTGRQRVHLNRAMIGEFFASARQVLDPAGVVLITVKDRPPYSLWNLESLAEASGMLFRAKVPFVDGDFAEYSHQTTDPGAKSLHRKAFTTQTYIFSLSQ